jgi:RNA polymerase sigma factor (sigma-70 family)
LQQQTAGRRFVDDAADAALVAQARAGDGEAFGALIGRYAPMAARLARRLVRDPDRAGDLVQEAALQAFLALDSLRAPERFRSWFYGIVLNMGRGELRARRTPVLSLEALAGGLRFEAIPFAVEPSPEEVLEVRELQAHMLDAVAVLPPKIRAATLLFYYEQRSLQEIAGTLGVSIPAVKSRLHEARKRMRVELALTYPDRVPRAAPKRRMRPMIQVTVADVVARGAAPERNFVVVLWDAAGRRLLPIWVGPAEGAAIAVGLCNASTPRPLTYPFIAGLLDAAGATVEAVEISALHEDTYHAVVRLRSGGTSHVVDARPSDALALAGRTGSPVYVAADLLDRNGIALPPERGAQPPATGAARLVSELEAEWRARPLAAARDAAEQEQSRQDFLAFLYADASEGGAVEAPA